MVMMSPTVCTEYTKSKEVIWQQYRLYLAIAEWQTLGGEPFLILGPESEKIWCLKKVQYLQKYHCQWTLLRGRQPKWICHNSAISHKHLSFYRPRVSKWFQRTGNFVQFLEIVHRRQKVILIQAPRNRPFALISDFLDLANLSLREEAAFATTWIKDRREGLKLLNLGQASSTGPAVRSDAKNTTADVQHALEQCESLGSGKNSILHGNPSAIAMVFSPLMSVFRRQWLPNASGESTASGKPVPDLLA